MSNQPIALTVIIPARDEARNLPRCLRAITFTDDVLVVDDRSTDDTAAVAREHGARVVSHQMASFADQRNWAMDHGELRHDWVLHLDADEVVTPALAAEISGIVREPVPGVAAYAMARKVMLGEKWLKFSATYPVYVPRLVLRPKVRFEEWGHGERLGRLDGKLGYLQEPCVHYNFSKGWAEWLERHNRYSTKEAERLVDEHARVALGAVFSSDPVMRRTALRLLSYKLPARPFLRLIYTYILRGGFLDGRAGARYAVLMAFYEYMITVKAPEVRR